MTMTRRHVVSAALAVGAFAAFADARGRSRLIRREAPTRYPQGVASGDPDDQSVILWTRYVPAAAGARVRITLEVAEDEAFTRLVASRRAWSDAASDWTCRVLVGGLAASKTYWYRFTDDLGDGSRTGRTRTAPAAASDRPVTFAFVSCQNVNLGPLTAWRRMLWDEAHAPEGDGIEFVLHLGDFVYDTVWYPEDRPDGYLDRKPRRIVTYPEGERHGDYHVPVSLADYRALYQAYLSDPDLQDARARWPFVAIWDNGEFSNDGWQGLQRFGRETIPAQTRKVAANQAWFEYLPSRARTRGRSLDGFDPPAVEDRVVDRFDADGLGIEPFNLAAIDSLVGYRTHRWGRHVELAITDQRSYRSEDYTAPAAASAIVSAKFPQLVPFETLRRIDAGASWAGGRPADTLTFGDAVVPNFRRGAGPRTLLGARQKGWLKERLASSTATWKIWANTVATFDMRADPQHLPAGRTGPWPGAGYAGFARTDHSTAFAERGEIMDFVRDERIPGFVTLSGDRHSFWAGYSAKALPPDTFEPVGINFVVGSISSPGMVEALEHVLPRDHPLRPLYLLDRPGEKPEPSVNLLLRHGVRSCLEYAETRDLSRAVALRDPDNAPHVSFVDMAGHGFGIVRASGQEFAVEFVCIPRPLHATDERDGGPVRYRTTHVAPVWAGGERPDLRRAELHGDAGLSA